MLFLKGVIIFNCRVFNSLWRRLSRFLGFLKDKSLIILFFKIIIILGSLSISGWFPLSTGSYSKELILFLYCFYFFFDFVYDFFSSLSLISSIFSSFLFFSLVLMRLTKVCFFLSFRLKNHLKNQNFMLLVFSIWILRLFFVFS